MKKFILAFVMSFMMCASVYAADQEVYIDQSGSNLDLDIDIIGTSNKVGSSSDDFEITGNYQDIDIDLTGAGNLVTGQWKNVGTDSAADLTLDVDGSYNTFVIDVGSSGSTGATGSHIIADHDVSGTSSAQSSHTWRIGNAATTTNVDFNLTLKGSAMTTSIIDNQSGSSSNAKTTVVTMDTSSAGVNIDVNKSGAGEHNTDLLIEGSFASGVMHIDQQGSQSSTVDVELSGASSGNVRVCVTGTGSDCN